MDVKATLIRVLAVDEGIAWAYLFGSAARGAAYRDVDVAIMPREGAYASLVDLGRLVARLEEVCGTKVDVVDLRAATLPFIGPMLRERVVLVDRARDARTSWEADTNLRWLDFKPTWDRFHEVRDEALRQRAQGRS